MYVVCVQVYTHTNIHTLIHTLIYILSYTHMYIHTYTHDIHIHTHPACVYIYTHIKRAYISSQNMYRCTHHQYLVLRHLPEILKRRFYRSFSICAMAKEMNFQKFLRHSCHVLYIMHVFEYMCLYIQYVCLYAISPAS